MKRRLTFLMLCITMMFLVACSAEGDYYDGFRVDNNVKEDGEEIPTGGEYTKFATKATYKGGQNMPETAEMGDIYKYGDYTYTMGVDGWRVELTADKTLEAYSDLLETIAGFPITDITDLYKGCANMKTSPKLPDSIVTMNYAFNGCTALTSAPEFPKSVKNIQYVFYECPNITNAPDIPEAVVNMKYAFSGCTNIKNTPKLSSGMKVMTNAFEGCIYITDMPEIPATVTDLSCTFKGCTSLVNTTVIPEAVDYLTDTFNGCTSLTGTLEINAKASNRAGCFAGVNFKAQGLEVTGTCKHIDKLLKTGIVEE